MKPFALDLNLDDEEECREFVAKWGNASFGEICDGLGINRSGGAQLAMDLRSYAHHKLWAIQARLAGRIGEALEIEKRCDRIYAQEIAPVCECW